MLVTGAGIYLIVIAVVIPGWQNYQRFLYVQRLAPQLTLVPAPATLVGKSQVTQPQILSTAVYIEYDYRLDRTISSAELQSYYDSQLTKRGWVSDGGANVIADTPSSANIYVSYHQPGQHNDSVGYSAHYFNGYYGGIRELDVQIRSLQNGSNN